jgi:GTP-binding protein
MTPVPNITSCTFIGSFYSLDQLPKDRRPQIAFAGRSNVGKSSLLNKLVGRRKMAKVSSTPGKTRSLNFFRLNERFYFVDLPGYGYARVSKKEKEAWRQLLEEYLESSRHLIGLVLLIDCRRDPTEHDLQLVDWLGSRGLPVIVALTKADKVGRDHLKRKVRSIESQMGLAVVPFSAVAGTGKNELLRAVWQLVDEHKPNA